MKYKQATIFSSGTEYEVFKDNYCFDNCYHHKEDKDGYPRFIEDGGCPIEDKMERARFDANEFPNVLVEVWDNEETKCFSWHVCPFFLDMKGGAE